MKKILIYSGLLTTILAVLYTLGAFTLLSPGVVFEVETTDHEQSPPRADKNEIKVEGSNLTMTITAPDGKSGKGKMIFRGDKGENGEVVMVDDDKKAYYVMDDAFVKAMIKQVEEAASQMDKMFEGLSKEQLDAIEKVRQQGAPGVGALGDMKSGSKPEIHNTGERAIKQGYPCVKYEVFQDDKKIREIWTTDYKNIDGGDEVEQAFRRLGAFFEAFGKAMPPMPGGEDPFGGENPFDEMNFGNGFPVGVTGFGEDGDIEDESWLKRTRRQRLDPDEFEPPSGYKRMSMGSQ